MIKRRLKRLKFATFGFLVLLLALFPVSSVFAAIGLGHGFYGTVKVGNVDADINTVISAQVAGTDYGTCTVTTPGTYALIVQGEIDDGATIHFYVGGQEADQTFPFHDGWTTELNLTAAAPPPVQYTLGVICDPIAGGSVTLEPPQPVGGYEADTSVELTATANTGYAFGSWSGDLTGSTNPDSIVMNSNKSVTANFVEFSAPGNVNVSRADAGVGSINVSSIDLSGVDTTNMPDGVEAQEAYVVDSTGTGSFTLRFTDITNASNIVLYKVVGTTWTQIPITAITVIDATTIEVTMEVGDPVLVFTLPTAAPSPPAGGGVGGVTYYIETDLFGVEKDYRISHGGKLLQTIGATSGDDNLTITIPKGTIALDKHGNPLESLEVVVDENPPEPPEDAYIIGLAYSFKPDGAALDPPMTLTWNFNLVELPEDTVSVTMAYYVPDRGWIELESEEGHVAELGTITAVVSHFTSFAILAKVAPPAPTPAPAPPSPPPALPAAHFVASGLNIESSARKIWEHITFVAKAGESVTIAASVANDGGQEGTYTVELKLSGETVDSKEVTLAAGQSQQVSFALSGMDYGRYEVEVAGLSSEFTVSRSINWWLIAGIIVAIGLIIWGVVKVRRRSY